MKESFEITEIFESTPAVIYRAWLDSEEHSKMIDGEANCSDKVGDSFSIWDGYITGTNIELTENKEIVQSWRTPEFADKDDDSLLTISLEQVENGTKLTLAHTNIPEGQTQYEQGWKDHYFAPMSEYFRS